MEEYAKKSKKMFVIHAERPSDVSTGDDQYFLALLTQLLPDRDCADEADLDKVIAAFAGTDVIKTVNETLRDQDLKELNSYTFRSVIDGLLEDIPQDTAKAIDAWIERFGIERINAPGTMLKFMTIIMVVIMMFLRSQAKLMETITSVE